MKNIKKMTTIILLLLALIVLFVLLLIRIRKISYYSSIIKNIGKAGYDLKDNYYYKYYCEDSNNSQTLHYYEKWVLDNKSKYIIEDVNNVNYNDYTNNIQYNINEVEKTYNMHTPVFSKNQMNKMFVNCPIFFTYPISYYKNEKTQLSYKDFIKTIKNIEEEYYESKPCYKITFLSDGIISDVWYSTDTYLIVGMRVDNVEYHFQFVPHEVRESDVTFNINEYDKIEIE